ncbi:3-keto-5-aminohexanoate cleavage protein [Nocardioides cavernae]|uniref:3-keto-5-aminohexanoate cleavage protein n=1 Tax=Nocardioides TaxID=1839 RepID=UPI000B275CE9|nr:MULTISPECIES: 3-keto-5-aminohexanoate cleavage protein [Nocardioides]MCK9821953.1 3-keto-5-aminohexanoate cleavage protein [Nocardioides cavernae]
MPPLLNDLDQPAPIVLAPTGMVPTRAMTPHVPLTPDEIAADVAAAAAIGITSVHIHARGEDGAPTWEREAYARIVGAVRESSPDVVINVSTSGRTWSEVERRADCLALDDDLKPDLASLTLSSLNFLTQASVNSPDTIHALARIMLDRGIVPELELFDFGMVNYVHVLRRKGLLPGPVVANLFFGNVAGMQPTLGEIGLAVDRLPEGTIWSGAGLGDFGLPVQTHSIAAGGGVRVGVEDGIWFDRHRTTLATNPMLVERVHDLLQLHGRTMMTPEELRHRLAQP